MMVMKKFVDRNKGINKTQRDYEIEAEPPIANFKDITPPENYPHKKTFYSILFFKIVLFFWIIYLLIIFLGFIALKIDPTLEN